MSVVLGGVDISGLVILENWNIPIIASAERASDGSLIMYEKEKLYNDITLTGGDDWGWLTYGILSQVKALAVVKGASYTLTYKGETFTVRFKTEDIPVINGDPIISCSGNDTNTLYNNIVIKLMEI